MSLPALPATADTRSITERVNVLIRDYNTLLGVPAGCIMPYAGATAPDGWLLCHGQAVSRTTYADLFAAIGTAYGQPRRRADELQSARLAGPGRGRPRRHGRRRRCPARRRHCESHGPRRRRRGGHHTLSTGEMPAHNHGVTDPGHAHSGLWSDPQAAIFAAQVGYGNGNNATVRNLNAATTGISIQNAGSGGAHNNTQPTLIINYVIAT